MDSVIIRKYLSEEAEIKTKPEQQIGDFNRQCILHAVTEETIENLRSALLTGMNKKRADDRTLWINVLQALAGLKENSFADAALELAHEFSKRCSDKYDPEDLDKRWNGMSPEKITFRSIFQWAQEDGWDNPHRIVIADCSFDNIYGESVSDLPVPVPQTSRFQFVPAIDFAGSLTSSWIIKDLIPQAELGVIYGASQSGKTFLVFDMVAAIARGIP